MPPAEGLNALLLLAAYGVVVEGVLPCAEREAAGEGTLRGVKVVGGPWKALGVETACAA